MRRESLATINHTPVPVFSEKLGAYLGLHLTDPWNSIERGKNSRTWFQRRLCREADGGRSFPATFRQVKRSSLTRASQSGAQTSNNGSLYRGGFNWIEIRPSINPRAWRGVVEPVHPRAFTCANFCRPNGTFDFSPKRLRRLINLAVERDGFRKPRNYESPRLD